MEEALNLVKKVSDNLVMVDKTIIDLNNKLSDTDKALSDIYHKIEFSNFNLYQAYMFAKEIKRLRNIRRDIKNQREILSTIFETLNVNRANIKNIEVKVRQKSIQQNNRKYTPRILNTTQ